MERHLGAARFPGHGLDGVIALAGALPMHTVLGGEPRPSGAERHPVGDDERGIEAHAELADQRSVLGGFGGQRFKEFAGAGLGDRSDVIDHLLARRTCRCRRP